ncbi:hypothetical protein B0H10DRAFT_2100573, partial [Mycena sp. CBHHK59/15]
MPLPPRLMYCAGPAVRRRAARCKCPLTLSLRASSRLGRTPPGRPHRAPLRRSFVREVWAG